MNIPSSKYLKKKAENRIAAAADCQKITLVYAGISLAMALLVTIVRFGLSHQISQAGGLRNLGLRSVLSTADSVLPILQSLLSMCLELGFVAATLRIARRQYASVRSLKTGLERFWVALRSNLLRGLMYGGTVLVSFYIAVNLFVISPLSDPFTQAVTPYIQNGNVSVETILQVEGLEALLLKSLTPMLMIYGVVLLVMLLPIFYRYRFTDYVIAERPNYGAAAAMATSRILMRGNFFHMLKLDLSFWWFYAMQLLAAVLAYADFLLALAGVALPVSETVSFFLTFLIYLAAEFSILYFFKAKVSVTYALAYDSVCPKVQNNGVVLGNIFQMPKDEDKL